MRNTPDDKAKDVALREAEAVRAQARALKAKRVKALLAEGMSLAEVGRAVGLHRMTVRNIRDDAPHWVGAKNTKGK